MRKIILTFMLAKVCFLASSQRLEEINERLVQLFGAGKYEEAIPVALQSKQMIAELNGTESKDYFLILTILGKLYGTVGNYKAAETFYKEALNGRKKVLGEEHPDYIISLNHLGVTYIQSGNYFAAEPLLSEVLRLQRKTLTEDNPDLGISMNNLADVYQRMGKSAEAESLLQELLRIRKRTPGEETLKYAETLNNIGLLNFETGNYVAAEAYLKQALAIGKRITGEPSPIALNNLALVLVKTGQYSQAELSLQQSLKLMEKNGGKFTLEYANTLNNLASLYDQMGNDAAGESLHEEALMITKQVAGGDHPQYAQILNDFGCSYIGRDNYNYSAAETLLKQALAIRKKTLGTQHPDYAETLNNLAMVYYYQSKFTESIELYKEVIAISKKSQGEEHPDYARILTSLGSIYSSRGDFASAEPLLLQAMSIIKKILGSESPEYADCISNLGGYYEGKGEYNKAAQYFMEGIAISVGHMERNFYQLSESEKLKWWDREKGNFSLLPSLLMSDPSLATSYLEKICTQQIQLKGYILNNGAKILQQSRKNSDESFKKLLADWQNNKIHLAREHSRPLNERRVDLDSLEKITNDQEKKINQQSAVFSASQQAKQIGFAQVSKSLRSGEAAIEFIKFHYHHKKWTDTQYYAAFVILPKSRSPQFVVLCNEQQLADLLDSKSYTSEEVVNQLYRSLGVKNKKQTDSRKGDSLYALIWKPLMPWLEGIKKIHIAPAGLLNRVAFSALRVDSNRFLIDNFQIRQYSSVRQIAEEKFPAANETSTAVLYGGITFTLPDITSDTTKIVNSLSEDLKRSVRGGVWNELPGTLKEVNSIQTLFAKNKIETKIFTGAEATEENLKSLSGHSPAILHLATHGFSLPDAREKNKQRLPGNSNQFAAANNPLLRSGIIMAGANRVWSGAAAAAGREDGIVTAYEISNMDMSKTRLVVLSACETALGDIKGTEGVFGLQRAFKLAGVESMLLSLWQVPDAETAELMTLLYTHMTKGMTTYDAFYQAQDIMRKKYDPFYWAAFVLIE